MNNLFPAPLYPTPVRHYPELGTARAELWVKNDGLSHPLYGGSKVRKAQRLVQAAIERGARRVVSVGAVGSHHLLTLTLFARAAGLSSAALVFAQPRSEHALETLRATLGAGIEAHAANRAAALPRLLAQLMRRGVYVIPPGGSNLVGTRACADSIDELVQQVEAGVLPLPDLIVTPLGSGGTCAGLAAGVVRRALPCRVVGVQVVAGAAPRLAARWLAAQLLARDAPALRAQLRSSLSFDQAEVGPGYGAASAASVRALGRARRFGLELDPTYTAKAFAAVLRLLERGPPGAPGARSRPLRVLYWHTLSARPLEPLLRAAPRESELPKALYDLLV